MGAILIQDATGSLVFYLELSAGGAAEALTIADVQVDLKKPSDVAFVNKVLAAEDWTELDEGFYELALDATDTDELGTLAVRITGATIKSVVELATVATAVSPSPTPSLAVPTAAIFGYIVDSSGVGVSGATVSARVLSQPTVLHPGDEGLVVSTSLVSTSSDSTGYFVLDLVSGASVDIFIPVANYRRTITVPASSANLFDIA